MAAPKTDSGVVAGRVGKGQLLFLLFKFLLVGKWSKNFLLIGKLPSKNAKFGTEIKSHFLKIGAKSKF